MDHLTLQPAAGETDVEVQAGDVVIGDSRRLHASHANYSGQRRTMITIWYWPIYSQLPAEVQALISDHVTDNADWVRWVEETAQTTSHLVPVYGGNENAVIWNNQPSDLLI